MTKKTSFFFSLERERERVSWMTIYHFLLSELDAILLFTTKQDNTNEANVDDLIYYVTLKTKKDYKLHLENNSMYQRWMKQVVS